ncbi:alkylated DNA repair protein alkB homolog 8-like isoform X1 [Rhopalosiphum maidis]|uniref:alkylated DNA repair protein alkB homolog 8-like isoform X1 n=1 Tax=Rhopalosiphum maidis TaxID=43146 RepID=UPI000EFF271C|nr:alkylated DNA repair protein alkB homolog 8-like isoform X1 [Rhopalosiphum maidis]
MPQTSKKKMEIYVSMLKKDMNIEASSSPTTNLMVCNCGLVNGLSRKDLLQVFNQYGQIEHIIMIPYKSYCFISFTEIEEAISAWNKVNGKFNGLSDEHKMFYLIYTVSIPQSLELPITFPPGLEIIDNFITEEEENFLLEYLNEHWSGSSSMKHRQVKHYGFEFNYDFNNVRYDTCDPIPKEFEFILNAIYLRLNWRPNQITINKYLPGQGIPNHIDNITVFDEYILSLSLNSDIVMEFRKDLLKQNGIFIKAKSLLIMSGESRYEWTHGITPRKIDMINTVDGPDVVYRGTRFSITFRRAIQIIENIQVTKDLYEILGCDKTTSFETLKDNYKKRLFKVHPDKSILSSSSAACAELNKAWSILKDPDLKKKYDEQIEQSDINTEVTIYDYLNISDLENNEIEDTFSYRCRCGGQFLVPKSMVITVDQTEPLLFPCDDCSLFIEVMLPNTNVSK